MDAREGLDEFKTINGLQDIPNLDNWKLIYQRQESLQNALIMSIGGKIIGAATKTHLKFESGQMLNMVMDDMIAGPGALIGTPVALAAPTAAPQAAPVAESPKVVAAEPATAVK
jgi:hypothetical protein